MKSPDTKILSEKEYKSALELINPLNKYDLWISSQYITMHLIFNNDKEFFFHFDTYGDNFSILNSTIDRLNNYPVEFSKEATASFLFEYNLKPSELKIFIRQIKKYLGYEVRPL